MASPADVWSVTSYNELRREALAWIAGTVCTRRRSRSSHTLLIGAGKDDGPIIAASDYMKVVPDQLAPWLGTRLVTLGTDGFGRSDNREHLRRHFEINAESIATAALSRLARDGKFDPKKAQKAFADLGVNRRRGSGKGVTGI